MLLFTKISIS